MIYNLVKKQHKHFGLLYTDAPRRLSQEEKDFYMGAMAEEVCEYQDADNLVDEYDALLDVIVFAVGAMLRHGFPVEGIEEVVRANMDKELGPIKDKRKEFKLDLKKPAGWKAPNLSKYLTKADMEFFKNQRQLAFDLPEDNKAMKFDAGKPPIDLIDSTIITELAKVLGYGAEKYEAHNWKVGLPISRYYSAAMRHLFAFNDGETNDPESGLNHLGHVTCNMMFMMYMLKNKPELDDRPEVK